jgi:flagellar biogenesis protein FliO
MKERRAKAKQEETIQTVLGVTVVLVLIIGFGYFMRWMFQQGG